MDPSTPAHVIPAWLAPWLIRFGVYLQAIGRECYHQCQGEKQMAIKDKLAKVYDGHEN